MGTSRTSVDLAKKLDRLPGELKKATPNALRAAGAKAIPVMQHAPGAAASVGGKKIRVTGKPIGDDGYSLKWGPPGWVRILNDRTAAHFIGARGSGSLRRQSSIRGNRRASRMAVASLFGGRVGAGVRKPIDIPGVGPRAFAHHPGTKGKHFVERGKELARPIITRTYAQKSVTEPLRRVIGG